MGSLPVLYGRTNAIFFLFLFLPFSGIASILVNQLHLFFTASELDFIRDLRQQKVGFRHISSARLRASQPLHLHPINLVIFQESIRSHLGARFALICFQRLSEPYIATQPCPWQDS